MTETDIRKISFRELIQIDPILSQKLTEYQEFVLFSQIVGSSK
jgi:hypothetical protein